MTVAVDVGGRQPFQLPTSPGAGIHTRPARAFLSGMTGRSRQFSSESQAMERTGKLFDGISYSVRSALRSSVARFIMEAPEQNSSDTAKTTKAKTQDGETWVQKCIGN